MTYLQYYTLLHMVCHKWRIKRIQKKKKKKKKVHGVVSQSSRCFTHTDINRWLAAIMKLEL